MIMRIEHRIGLKIVTQPNLLVLIPQGFVSWLPIWGQSFGFMFPWATKSHLLDFDSSVPASSSVAFHKLVSLFQPRLLNPSWPICFRVTIIFVEPSLFVWAYKNESHGVWVWVDDWGPPWSSEGACPLGLRHCNGPTTIWNWGTRQRQIFLVCSNERLQHLPLPSNMRTNIGR